MAGSESLDNMLMCTQSENGQAVHQQEKKPRPADEQALKCPRCDSANTKFCYYNNYSLTQPRYFCKSCRRYWTKGGTLRNVPVGGGCRKNKRSSSLSKRSPPSDYPLQLQPDHLITNHTTTTSYDHHHHHHHPALAPHGNSSIIPLYDGNSHFDLFGGGGNSFLDTLRGGGGGLVECNNSNHLLYYGLDTGGAASVNVSRDDHHELTMHYDDQKNNSHLDIMSNPSSGSSTPRMKQEVGESRMLWGFPWQLNGEGIQGNYINGGGNHEIDSLKENWNTAFVGSSWNNLLNSPLM